MHCNLKPTDVVSVVLGFNYDFHDAPEYQISTQSGNALLSYK